MDTKEPTHPAGNRISHILVNCNAFTHFVVSKPTLFNVAEPVADNLLKQWTVFLAQQKYWSLTEVQNILMVILEICTIVLALNNIRDKLTFFGQMA